jgi:hypothetical protein
MSKLFQVNISCRMYVHREMKTCKVNFVDELISFAPHMIGSPSKMNILKNSYRNGLVDKRSQRPVWGAEPDSPQLFLTCSWYICDVAYGTWCPRGNYPALNSVDVHRHRILSSQNHLSGLIILRIIRSCDWWRSIGFMLCYSELWVPANEDLLVGA